MLKKYLGMNNSSDKLNFDLEISQDLHRNPFLLIENTVLCVLKNITMKSKILGPLSITALFMLLNAVTASAQYCVSKSNAPWELWIKNVQFGTINNASEKAKDYNSVGYSDFTNVNGTFIRGQRYTLNVTAGTSWSGIADNAYCRAWIDYNFNNIFEEAEIVLEKNGSALFSEGFFIPNPFSTSGTARLRVAVKQGSYPTSCATFDSGEVEDYTISIQPSSATDVPDLALENLNFPTTIEVNRRLTFSYAIHNVGNTALDYAATSQVFLSRDTILSEDDLRLHSKSSNNYFIDAANTLIDTASLSAIWTTANAYFIVVIAPSYQELNLTNNTLTRRVAVTLPPQSCANTLGNGKILCFDNSNVNAINVFVAEGNAVVQKILTKDGNLLSSTTIGSLAKDSIFVLNNQVIKKRANGTIAYTKNISPSVLTRVSSINAAAEFSDGSFVLGGFQKSYTQVNGATLSRDSLILVTTDAQLNFQDSAFITRNSEFGSITKIPKDSLQSLILLPDNSVVAIYNKTEYTFSVYNILSFVKLQKIGTKLTIQKFEAFNFANFTDKPILTNSCGNNLLFSTQFAAYGGKGSSSGNISYQFNLDSFTYKISKSVGTGSADYYGSYRVYSYSSKDISVSYSGNDPRDYYNSFQYFDIFFYDNQGTTIQYKKTIPFVAYDHIIRTGDTTCLILVNGNGTTTVFNPDCNNLPNTLPDLTLANLNPRDPSVSQGQILNFSFDGKNMASGNATNTFTIKSYLSLDNKIDSYDYQDGVISTANYGGNTTIPQIQGAMRVRDDLPVGDYYLILKIDADNQIAETNEYNNVMVSKNTIDITSRFSCRYEDSLQLVRLYNATNGANWTNKWRLNTPINTWFGITLNTEGCVDNINLPSNNLVGTIPSNFSFTKLKLLILHANQLTGAIPNLNLPTLTHLVLSENQLSGTIPNFNLPNLTYLTLKQNQLSGALPNFNLPNLQNLLLQDNQLTGTIPNFNLPNLQTLWLTNNQLTGAISNVNLPTLHELDLRKNQLTGPIPPFNLPVLFYINLSENQLSGTIPNLTLPNVSAVILSFNQLSGTIPNFNFPRLNTMELTGNQLNGAIPSFDFPELERLSLLSNRLSGCIPLSLKRYCGKTFIIDRNPDLATQDFNAFCANNTGACTIGGASADLAVSLTSTPSVYRPFSTQNFTITAKNNGNQAFTDVRIDFPYPIKTVNGGNARPSIGTWQEWCSGGIQCFTWTIPTLAPNATATLEVPVYVLDAVNTMTATTHLLSSNPVDNNVSNNVATLSVNRSNTPIQPLIQEKPRQSMSALVQRITPTLTDNYIMVELESSEDKTIDFQIINALGTVVITEKIAIESGYNKRQFDVSQLPKGLYLLQTSVGLGQNEPMKFIKF
jgi:hypothetical protein